MEGGAPLRIPQQFPTELGYGRQQRGFFLGLPHLARRRQNGRRIVIAALLLRDLVFEVPFSLYEMGPKSYYHEFIEPKNWNSPTLGAQYVLSAFDTSPRWDGNSF